MCCTDHCVLINHLSIRALVSPGSISLCFQHNQSWDHIHIHVPPGSISLLIHMDAGQRVFCAVTVPVLMLFMSQGQSRVRDHYFELRETETDISESLKGLFLFPFSRRCIRMKNSCCAPPSATTSNNRNRFDRRVRQMCGSLSSWWHCWDVVNNIFIRITRVKLTDTREKTKTTLTLLTLLWPSTVMLSTKRSVYVITSSSYDSSCIAPF